MRYILAQEKATAIVLAVGLSFSNAIVVVFCATKFRSNLVSSVQFGEPHHFRFDAIRLQMPAMAVLPSKTHIMSLVYYNLSCVPRDL